MRNPHDQNAQGVILDVNHDAPVTDTIAPERTWSDSASALEGRTEAARIFPNANAVLQEQGDAPHDLSVEPA